VNEREDGKKRQETQFLSSPSDTKADQSPHKRRWTEQNAHKRGKTERVRESERERERETETHLS
jgi:hypothetical protein